MKLFSNNNIALYNEDCFDVLKIIPEKSIDLVLCDLPYSITQLEYDKDLFDLEKMWKYLDKICKENTAYIFTAQQPFTTRLINSNIKYFKYTMVWEKNLKTGNLNAKKRPMGGHEDIVVFYKKQPTYNPQKRKRTTEIKSGNKKNSKTSVYGKQKEDYIDNQSDWINPDTIIKNIKCVHNSSGKIHPNQKPIELMEYLIKTYSNENDVVLDITFGSCSTGIASLNLNRKFIGCEKSEKYYHLGLFELLKCHPENNKGTV